MNIDDMKEKPKPGEESDDPLRNVKKKFSEVEVYIKGKAADLDLRMTLFLKLKAMLVSEIEFVTNNQEDFVASLDTVTKEITTEDVKIEPSKPTKESK